MDIKKITEQFKQYLVEVSVSQLKKQNPGLSVFIDKLIKNKVENKYIHYAVLKRKEGTKDMKERGHARPSMAYRIDQIIHSIDRFNELITTNTIDRMIKKGLVDKRAKDISFWHKKKLSELNDFLDKTGKISIVRRKIQKAPSGSKIIYKDDKYTIYHVEEYDASCKLGAGTKWCIASEDGSEWYNHSEGGSVFFFVFDRTRPSSDPFYKLAVETLVWSSGSAKWEYIDARDRYHKFPEIYKEYGDDWDKLRSIIAKHAKDADVTFERGTDEIWYGDTVRVYDSFFENDIYYLIPVDSTDLENILDQGLKDEIESTDFKVIGPSQRSFVNDREDIEVEFKLDKVYWDEENDITKKIDKYFSKKLVWKISSEHLWVEDEIDVRESILEFNRKYRR